MTGGGMKKQTGVMPLLGREHDPSHVDSLFRLEKGKEWIIPESLKEKHRPADPLIFSPENQFSDF